LPLVSSIDTAMPLPRACARGGETSHGTRSRHFDHLVAFRRQRKLRRMITNISGSLLQLWPLYETGLTPTIWARLDDFRIFDFTREIRRELGRAADRLGTFLVMKSRISGLQRLRRLRASFATISFGVLRDENCTSCRAPNPIS
jgi:hypothetical protein